MAGTRSDKPATRLPVKPGIADRFLTKSIRRQRNRWERERILQRIAVATVAVVILLVFAIPAYGYYREVIARGQEEIARVNNVGYKMEDYIRDLRYRQRQIDSQVSLLNQFGGGSGAAQQVAAQRSILPTQLVFDWVDEEIFRQAAPKMGLGASPEEVDARLRKDFEPPASSDDQKALDPGQPTPTPTPPPAPFEERYRQVVQYSGLSDADFRKMTETRILREKVETKLKESVPTTGEQVHIRVILASQESEAKAALDRLLKGDSWDDVASELSSDAQSRDKGGDLGWIPRGLKDEEFDKAAFGLTLGPPRGPFSARQGFYVMQLIETAQVRPIEGDTLVSLKSATVSKWLEDQKKPEANAVEYRITSDRQLWAQDRIDREQKAERRRLGQVPLDN